MKSPILTSVLVFTLIFGPIFYPVSKYLDSIFFLSFIIWSIGKFRISKSAFLLVPIFVFTFITSARLLLIYDEVTVTIRYLLKPLRIILTFIACGLIVKDGIKRFNSTFIHKIVFYSIALHALIMIIQFFDENFRAIIYEWTSPMVFRSTFEYNFRMGGLSGGSGGAILSVVQAVGVLNFTFWRKMGIRPRFVDYLCLIVIVASVVISGRSGLLVVLICLVALILRSEFHIKLRIFLLVSVIVSGMSHFFNINENINLILSRQFDMVIGEGSTLVYSNNLKTYTGFLQLPSSAYELFVGDVYHFIHDQEDRLLDSDSGYVRLLWGSGVILSILYLAPLFYILIQSWHKRQQDHVKYLLALVTVILLFNFKENFVYTRMLWSVLSIAYFQVRYHKTILIQE